MAIEDKSKLKLSRRVASVWVVISMAAAVIIGICGYTLMKNGVITSYENNSQAETLIIDVARVISSYGYIPALVGGIILAGILAPTMSTSDSQLLNAASSISQNIVQEVMGKKLSAKTSMALARGSVFIIAGIAVLLALDSESSYSRSYHLLGVDSVHHSDLPCSWVFSGREQISRVYLQA